MVTVSNRKLCKGTKRYVGLYVGVIFPIYSAGTKICFDLYTDFDKGGFAMLNGVIMKQTKRRTSSTTLNFCANSLNAGNQVLEVYGSNKCCDKQTKWRFQVNGTEW